MGTATTVVVTSLTLPNHPPPSPKRASAFVFVLSWVQRASGSCSSSVFVFVVVVAAVLAVWFGFVVGGCARRCGVVHPPSSFTCWVEVVSGAG